MSVAVKSWEALGTSVHVLTTDPDQLAGAKGRSAHTLEAVERLLASGGQELSAAEVAEMTGMSRATAQRYLSHLHEIGRVEIRLRYGSGGRPEHRYRWCRAGQR